MKFPKVVVAMALAVVAVVAHSIFVAPRKLRVVKLQVASPGLPEAWIGVRIAHLSDFHLGARGTSIAMLQRARRIALEFQPDIVALTGDFRDNGIAADAEGLWSDWPTGPQVFGVLGNHDFRGAETAPRQLVDELEAGGVRVLRNRAERISLRGQPSWIVGIDDPFTWKADERAAFCDVPDCDQALLYLAHSPSVDRQYPIARARLVLSGHTHGGQVRLMPSGSIPGVNVLRRARGVPPRRDPPVYIGCHWLRGSVVVISEGLGVSRLPVRFFTRPQVVLIELTCADRSETDCDDVRRYVRKLH